MTASRKNTLPPDDPVPLVLFTLDPAGMVLTVAGGLPEPYNTVDILPIGASIFDILSSFALDTLIEAFRRALTGRIVSAPLETDTIAIDIHLLPSLGPDGAVTGVAGIAYDATQRKRSEAALRESEERYRSVVAVLTEGITVTSADGTLLAANEAAQRILRMGEDQLTGKAIDSFTIETIDENSAPFLPENYPVARTFRTGQPQTNVIMGFRQPQGDITWLSVNSQPIWGTGHNRPEAVVTSFSDITDRRRDAEALRRSEQHNKTLLQAIPDLMLVLSAEGTFLDFRADPDQELLLPREHLIGSTVWDMPLPEEMKLDLLRGLHRAIVSGETQTVEYSVGATSFFEARFAAVDENQVLAIVRDISERKQAEAELQRRVDILAALQKVDDDLTKSLDMDYVLAVALDTALAMSGAHAGFIAVLEGDEVRYGRTTPGYPPLKDARSRRVLAGGLFARALATREAVVVENVQREPDYTPLRSGTNAQLLLPLVSHETLVGLLSLESDRVGGFREQASFMELLAARIAVALDNARLYQVTRQQLGELQTLYMQVKELEQLKTHMIRVAAHDLRSPLGVVSGYLALMQDDMGQAGEVYHHYFEAMNRAVQRMERMTSDVLSLERIHAVQAKALELIDLRALLERAETDIGHEAAEKQVAFATDAPAYAVVVQVDPVQIYEAISNLIDNAIKYTPAGGSVTLALRVERRQAVVEVTDTGIGVPDEYKDQLFQPFYRVHTRETQTIDGTGLGLYLVRSIVERHHGILRFSSVEGQGSSFGFELPLFEPIGNR